MPHLHFSSAHEKSERALIHRLVDLEAGHGLRTNPGLAMDMCASLARAGSLHPSPAGMRTQCCGGALPGSVRGRVSRAR